MKLTVGVLVFLLGAGSAAVSPLEAQSLAEIAKKEKQRRKKLKGSQKVITNDDLRRGTRAAPPSAQASPSPSTAAAPAGEAAESEDAAEEKTPEELRQEQATKLQADINAEVENIQQTQTRVDELQSELNDLSTMTFGSRRQRLLDELEKGKAAIAQSEQKIEDLTEQARRAGVRVSRGQ